MSIANYIKDKSSVSYLTSLIISRVYTLLKSIFAFKHYILHFHHSYISWGARVTGWSSIKIGKNVVIASGTWLNVNHRKNKQLSLFIGDNSFIGRNNFVTVGKSIIIREYCLTAANCAFIGSSHMATNPLHPYSTTGTTDTDNIYIGVNCFFGYGAVVIGNVNIGHGSIIGSSAVVRSNIPPFSIVVGNPARIIKRYCFKNKKWISFENNYTFDYISEDEYLKKIQDEKGFIIQPLSAAATFFGDI